MVVETREDGQSSEESRTARRRRSAHRSADCCSRRTGNGRRLAPHSTFWTLFGMDLLGTFFAADRRAVLGCGSVGAPVAHALARSGAPRDVASPSSTAGQSLTRRPATRSRSPPRATVFVQASTPLRQSPSGRREMGAGSSPARTGVQSGIRQARSGGSRRRHMERRTACYRA
jgi:hypothetical protein